MNKSDFKKAVWVAVGFIFMGIGFVGVVVPVLPTTPFLLVASFAFARGSDKFKIWFLSTKLYKNHLEEFDQNRSMTLKTKICILIPATAMLLIAFFLMKNIYGKIFICALIAVKYLYFSLCIRTVKHENKK